MTRKSEKFISKYGPFAFFKVLCRLFFDNFTETEKLNLTTVSSNIMFWPLTLIKVDPHMDPQK